MKPLFKLLAIGVLALAPACSEGEAAVEQAVLFSALEGQVVQGDQPLGGATLIREWEFAEDSVQGRDETITDASGHFAFPAVTHAYRQPRFFVQEKVITQLIRVQAGNKEWRAWAAVKHNIKPGTESGTFSKRAVPSDVPLHVKIDVDSAVEKRGSVIGHTFFAAAL
jgi:hypothetical protein